MFSSEYTTSTGKKFCLAMMKERKRPQLFVMTESGWKRIAQVDSDEGLKRFCDVFNLETPSWLGKSYKELEYLHFPWLAEKEAPND